jgi:hypothetical protein
MRSTICFASLSVLAVSALGCAVEPAGSEAGEQVTEELTKSPPTPECREAARQAVLAVEGVNARKIGSLKFELVDGHSDRENIRVTVKYRTGQRDSYFVNTESMGGSPCFTYGLQIKSQEIGMTDDGAKLSSTPSAACADAATRAVRAIEQKVNGHPVTIDGAEHVAAHSDREIVRVLIRNFMGGKDSYFVNTESLGGAPCLVYGLQVKSQEIELLDR